jgi:hypothetical protein
VNVFYNPKSKPKIKTKDAKTGNIEKKDRPAHIGGMHEVIHGDRSMRGKAIDYSKKDTQEYKTKRGKVKEQVPREEMATIGTKHNKKDDITENDLRKEQGVEERGAY